MQNDGATAIRWGTVTGFVVLHTAAAVFLFMVSCVALDLPSD
jgi:hypothetical protein